MSEAPPEALTAGEMHIATMGADASRLVTYSATDPLEVPNLVLALLPFFDGRPTESVLAAIAERTGVTPDVDLVQKLADFDVLKPKAPECPFQNFLIRLSHLGFKGGRVIRGTGLFDVDA
jgi:hypothetical protein